MLGPALRLERCRPPVAPTALAAGCAIGYLFNFASTRSARCDDDDHHQQQQSLPHALSPRPLSSSTSNKAIESPVRLYSPISPIRIFRPNPDLEIAFDVRTKNPVYVLERLDPDAAAGWSGGGRRPRHRFYESTLLPDMYRSRNASYRGSGYDRGHLAAAANYATPSAIYDTYSLCNASPQDPRLNATAWVRLEDWTRRVAASMKTKNIDGTCCDTFVVTGPLWLPARRSIDNDRRFEYQYPAIGTPPHLVSVPTHFFKLVAVVAAPVAGIDEATRDVTNSSSGSRIVAYACFVVPNRNVLDDAHSDWTVEDNLVAWTDLEAVSGLQFFTELVDDDWKAAADAALVATRRHMRKRRLPQQGQQQLLLPSGQELTVSSGASKAKSTSVAKKFPPTSSGSAVVSHLCPNGSCPKY